MLFCHITTHIQGRPDDDLLRVVGGTGFPSIFILDELGTVLAKHQGRWATPDFEKTVAKCEKQLARVRRLHEKAEKGDRGAKAALLALGLHAGTVRFDEGKAQLEALGKLSGRLAKDIDAGLAYAEYREVLRQVSKDGDAAPVLAGSKFAAMARDGRIPPADKATYFWLHILSYAESEGDLKLFDRARRQAEAQFKALYGKGSPTYRRLADRIEEQRARAKNKRKDG